MQSDDLPYKVTTKNRFPLAAFENPWDAEQFAKKKAEDTGLNWYRLFPYLFVVTGEDKRSEASKIRQP